MNTFSFLLSFVLFTRRPFFFGAFKSVEKKLLFFSPSNIEQQQKYDETIYFGYYMYWESDLENGKKIQKEVHGKEEILYPS